jgi:hypothetical protein
MKFKDLTDSAKYSIISDHMDIIEWDAGLISTIKEELLDLGFVDIEICYSGFYSQGDGASFTAASVELDTFFDKFWKDIEFNFTGAPLKKEVQDVLDMFGIAETFLIKEMIDAGMYSCRIVRTSHMHVHENTTTSEFEKEFDLSDYYENPDENLEQETINFSSVFESFIDEWVVDKNLEIFDRLKKEYEEVETSIMDEYNNDESDW